MTKLCKDCRHCVVKNGDWTHSKCAVSEKSVDYVTGTHSLYFCDTERMFSYKSCGPRAKNFEPIVKGPTLLQRLRKRLGGLFK